MSDRRVVSFAPIVRCFSCGVRLAVARLLCPACAPSPRAVLFTLLFDCLDCSLPVAWERGTPRHQHRSRDGSRVRSCRRERHRARPGGIVDEPRYALIGTPLRRSRSLDGDARQDDGEGMNGDLSLTLPLDPEALEPELARRLADPTLTKRFSIEIEIRLSSGGKRSFSRAIEAPRADDAIEAAERLPFEDWLDGDEEISDYEIRASGWQSL